MAEVAQPMPTARQIRVRVHAAAVNPIDAKIRAGSLRAIIRPALPFTPGMDVSGVVDAVGAQVTRFKPGDEVFASPSHKTMGSYAEFVCFDEREAAPKPRNLDHVQAASLPLVGLTAWDALTKHLRVQQGQSVLIHAGAGGLGTIAIQLAKHLGARVYTTCSAGNVAFVKSLGADVAIDYAKEDYAQVAKDVDAVVESLGGEHMDRAIQLVKRGGRVALLTSGMADGVKRFGLALGVLHTAGRLLSIALKARFTRGVVAFPMNRRADGESLAKLGALVEQGVIKPVIDSVLSLDQIVLAHEKVESGRCRGKVVLAIA
ncbi:MAG: NADP-dependent oxidoreductase [Deltaproteobacteria bacterium]|nr:NADP-dependent oxidoreductase [Deltaproteobacteria bacterium]